LASRGWTFETAVRERIPILSVLLNNFSMAIELKVMPISTEKYRSTDISGDYAAMARAFGGHGEWIEQTEDIIPAIQRVGSAQRRKESQLCWNSSHQRRPRSLAFDWLTTA
jgi:thiamine pyrophosphate-dependent acetolactate synthase large subunit-like protein